MNKLKEIDNGIEKTLVEKFFRKGAVVASAIGEGYMELWIDKKSCNNTQCLLNEIYFLIDNAARKKEVKEIPVVFSDGSDFKIVLDAGREDKYRPIWGGIRVENRDPWNPGYWIVSTIGYPAKRYGTKGYIITGHTGNKDGTKPIQPGYQMYQPKHYEQAGSVTDVGGTYSDAAFVSFSNVGPYIYTVPYGYHLGLVIGYRDPSIGDYVYMSGLASGWVAGEVAYTNVVVHSPAHGYLYEQMAATYPATHGDSGAPILNYWREILPGLAFVKVDGLHMGRGKINSQYYSIFSPQSGVYKDIHARPLVIGG